MLEVCCPPVRDREVPRSRERLAYSSPHPPARCLPARLISFLAAILATFADLSDTWWIPIPSSQRGASPPVGCSSCAWGHLTPKGHWGGECIEAGHAGLPHDHNNWCPTCTHTFLVDDMDFVSHHASYIRGVQWWVTGACRRVVWGFSRGGVTDGAALKCLQGEVMICESDPF